MMWWWSAAAAGLMRLSYWLDTARVAVIDGGAPRNAQATHAWNVGAISSMTS